MGAGGPDAARVRGALLHGPHPGNDVAAVSSVPEGAPPTATWNTYIWVESADATAEKVREAGGAVLSEPFDVFDAGRMAVCSRPGGSGVQSCGSPTATAVRPSSTSTALSTSTTSTRAIQSAPRPSTAPSSAGQRSRWTGGFTAWTLPGYGDFLETINPGTRERNAALGAPAGFADVVATLTVLGDDHPDTPAHWGVTFGVANADAAAERTAALGGTVVAGPFDAPWVRMVVIADPQGATFVASQFVPEHQDAGAAS